MKATKKWLGVALGLALLSGGSAMAQEKWWPVKVFDATTGKNVPVDYSPLPKAAKPWKLCVLFPHMKDSLVAVAYGIVEEAKRMGVNMTLYEAGGYENLPKQLSQFDDCMASGFDAIIVGAISEAWSLSQKFKEGIAKGKPVISTVNPVAKAETTAKMFVEFDTMGKQTGEYLVQSLKGKAAQVVNFPGPAGSGWAESFNDGFKAAIKGTKVKLLDEKFGDSGVAVQPGLVQDALQTYPDMNVIWGTAPTAEAAIGAVAEIGRKDIMIMSSYENQAMLDALNKGEILGFATQYPVLEGRVAIDMAVRSLEKKPVMKFVKPIPDMVAKSNQSKINMSLVLAPATWKPVYSVSAK